MRCRISQFAQLDRRRASMAATITIDGNRQLPGAARKIATSAFGARPSGPTFSDDEIKDGFFKTAFRAELQFGRPARAHPQIRRAGPRVRRQSGRTRSQSGNRGDRRRHSRPRESSRFGADDRSQKRKSRGDAGADARFRTDHPFPLWRGRSRENSTFATSAMPVGNRQGSELSHSARRGHPAGRCWRISILRLRL